MYTGTEKVNMQDKLLFLWESLYNGTLEKTDGKKRQTRLVKKRLILSLIFFYFCGKRIKNESVFLIA